MDGISRGWMDGWMDRYRYIEKEDWYGYLPIDGMPGDKPRVCFHDGIDSSKDKQQYEDKQEEGRCKPTKATQLGYGRRERGEGER